MPFFQKKKNIFTESLISFAYEMVPRVFNKFLCMKNMSRKHGFSFFLVIR